MINQIYKCILILQLSNKIESYDEVHETAVIILAETEAIFFLNCNCFNLIKYNFLQDC